jgi:MFS family permease
MMRRLLRIRNARIFLFGNAVSTLGDSSLWFAMGIWMKELTGSSAWAGLVFFCYIAGNLFSPFGGMLADRFPRRPLLVVANLLGAAIALPIALVHGRGDIWVIYVVIFLYGVTGSAIGAAQTALVPALVPPDLLAEANGAQQTLNQGLQLVTPLIGAGLFTVVGGAVIAEIDAGTFLVAVVSLLLLRMAPAPEAAAVGAPADGHGGMAAGFRFIWAEPVLRAIMLALGLSVLTVG